MVDIEIEDAPAATDEGPAAPSPPPAGATRWARGRAWVVTPVGVAWVIAVAAAIASLVVRWWEVHGRIPGWWPDTGAYDDVSQRSIFSGRFWAAERPAGVPLVFKIVGDPPSYRFQMVNIGVACVAWGWLCGELVRWLRVVGIRAVAVGAAVIGLSFTSDLVLWDSQVLSESLAISLNAAVVAALVRLVRVRSLPSAVILLVVAFLWTLMRDTNAMTLLVLAAAAAIWVRRYTPPDLPRRVAAVTVVGLLLVAGSSMTSAWVGHRDIKPLADVFAARILGYPERVRWFADHGMPQTDEILEKDKSLGPPPMMELGQDDPHWAEWWRWLEDDGKAAWLRFIVENPTYLLEPMKDPERVYNNSALRGYAGTMRVFPFVNEILWAPTTLVIFAVGGFSLSYLVARRRPPPIVVLAWVLIAAAALSAFGAWHTGGMESTRHLLLSAFQLRLGLVLVAFGVLLPTRPADAEDAATIRV